ncbi:MAG: LysR substrate-binding domain-containing protein [Oceanospirillaceae bacterium]
MSLPSLNSLRTFESAARLQSFALAAQELYISPSAVSHQIRQLEQRLGVTLFIRLDRKVVLSDAGAQYYPEVQNGITTLLNATDQLLKKNSLDTLAPTVIQMSVVPFFATRWLLLRLHKFRTLYPLWQIKMQTSTDASDFDSQDFDLVIRRGTGPWQGMISKLLCKERLAAVCHPDLAKTIKQPIDLIQQPLLFNAKVMSEWHEWFEAQSLSFNQPAVSLEFQNTSQILDACLVGAGVALVDPMMISQEIAQGKLINLFSSSMQSLRHYFIVYPLKHQQNENIKIFEQWLLKEVIDDPSIQESI